MTAGVLKLVSQGILSSWYCLHPSFLHYQESDGAWWSKVNKQRDISHPATTTTTPEYWRCCNKRKYSTLLPTHPSLYQSKTKLLNINTRLCFSPGNKHFTNQDIYTMIFIPIIFLTKVNKMFFIYLLKWNIFMKL